ncbi:MAG: metal-dependent hydrolase [Thermofilum sp.]
MRVRMKWVNHKITTFSLVFLVTHDFLSSLAAAGGSVLPDALEGRDSPTWKREHRKVSHWLLGYVSVAFVLWAVIVLKTRSFLPVLPGFQFLFSPGASGSGGFTLFFLCAAFYLTVGSILHILEDSLTGSVPVMHPRKRTFSVRIMKTGDPLEYILSCGLLFAALSR